MRLTEKTESLLRENIAVFKENEDLKLKYFEAGKIINRLKELNEASIFNVGI